MFCFIWQHRLECMEHTLWVYGQNTGGNIPVKTSPVKSPWVGHMYRVRTFCVRYSSLRVWVRLYLGLT